MGKFLYSCLFRILLRTSKPERPGIIQSKIIKSNIGYIKIDTFLDFGLDGVYNPKVLEDIPKTKMKMICNSIIKHIENVKDCNYIILVYIIFFVTIKFM